MYVCISVFNLTSQIVYSIEGLSLKSGSLLLKKICLIKSPFKMIKNAFYFILKAPFIFKIFKFLSGLFGDVGKTA